MVKYRTTFYNNISDKEEKYDNMANNSDEAFQMAYKQFKNKHGDEPYYCGYTDATTSEIPTGITRIGIRFSYTGKWNGSQYMFIMADGEDKAKAIYDSTYKGKRFYQPWPDKIDDNGNCIYGNVIETYYC